MQFPWSTVNGVETEHVALLDRGLHYGDGLFETCLFSNGAVVLSAQHIQRLLTGLQALRLSMPRAEIEQYLAHTLQHLARHHVRSALIKLIITRGVSGRGYFPEPDAKAACIIIVYAPPHYTKNILDEGVAAALCQQRLPVGDVLGGVKHLNRLHQILATSEWKSRGVGHAEGLLLDTCGNVVEGTFSNLFMVENDGLVTPDTSQCGVNGVMRDYLLQTVLPQLGIVAKQTTIKLDRLLAANEIFLCNSVYGIWPIRALEVKEFFPGGITHRVTAAIRSLGYEALYH